MTVYRPTHRNQFSDPTEPHPIHRSNNCTMAAGAMALDAHTRGDLRVGGGDLRHRQSDQEGGTDLGDLKRAWATYGRNLAIRSGTGWDGVRRALLDEGRGVVLQGDSDQFSNATCSGAYDGPHAVYVSPEPDSAGTVPIGDPICNAFRRERLTILRDYAEKFYPDIRYAVTAPLTEAEVATLKNGVPVGVQVAGVGGIPPDAIAMLGTLSIVNPSGTGYGSAYPTADGLGTTVINFQRDQNASAGLTARLGGLKTYITIRGATTLTAHLVIDAAGWVTPEGHVAMLPAPVRIFDSRT